MQIFATDIDEPMLHKARSASYPQGAVKDVPLELLDRYFFAHDDDFVLVQPIRDMVRVSNHNLIKDPPFSRVDLVVCRNLLIYLNADLQQRLIPVFHYALRPGGYLFLGSAENIASRNDLFEALDPGTRIYRRRGAARQSVSMPLFVDPMANIVHEKSGRMSAMAERADTASRRMLERYAPPHVIVNVDNDVIRSSARTGKYLELAEGSPSTKVTDSGAARASLRRSRRSRNIAAHAQARNPARRASRRGRRRCSRGRRRGRPAR